MAIVRSLTSKIEELDAVAQLNGAHVIPVTETWLADVIPHRAVNIPDFIFMRKERQHCNENTGGVIIQCRYCLALSHQALRPWGSTLWSSTPYFDHSDWSNRPSSVG
jgi:hypothetical protein